MLHENLEGDVVSEDCLALCLSKAAAHVGRGGVELGEQETRLTAHVVTHDVAGHRVSLGQDVLQERKKNILHISANFQKMK